MVIEHMFILEFFITSKFSSKFNQVGFTLKKLKLYKKLTLQLNKIKIKFFFHRSRFVVFFFEYKICIIVASKKAIFEEVKDGFTI